MVGYAICLKLGLHW